MSRPRDPWEQDKKKGKDGASGGTFAPFSGKNGEKKPGWVSANGLFERISVRKSSPEYRSAAGGEKIKRPT